MSGKTPKEDRAPTPGNSDLSDTHEYDCGCDGHDSIPLCGVCLNGVSQEEEALLNTWCSSSNLHEAPATSVHTECFMAMLSSRIESAFPGSCSSISCPCVHIGAEGKRDHDIPYVCWVRYAPEELEKRYQILCEDLLPFLCGNCHCQRTCLVRYIATDHPVLHTQEYTAFIMYQLPLEAFYSFVMRDKSPPEDMAGGGHVNDAAWNYIFPILQVVEDPALRANLQLRHYRDYPTFRTSCCKTPSCFSCKSASHVGSTCQANLGGNCDNDIIYCPKCGIALTKGDGCDAVVCVCRANLSWGHEKKERALVNLFTKAYPENTTYKCAEVIYQAWASRGNNSSVALSVPLLSWKSGSDAYRRRYHNDVNAHLLRLWESLHGYHHPHDCEKVAMNQGNGKAQDAIPALPTSATTSTLSLRIAQRLVPSVESAKQLVRSTSPLPYPMTGQSKLHVQRLPPFAFAASVRYTKDSADPPALWAHRHKEDTTRMYINAIWTEHVHTSFDTFYPRDEDKADAAVRMCSGFDRQRQHSSSRDSPFGDAVMASARRWYDDPSNRQNIHLALCKLNARAVEQFLYWHGSARVVSRHSDLSAVSVTSTAATQIPTSLEYSRHLLDIMEKLWFSNSDWRGATAQSVKGFMRREYIDGHADAFEERACTLLKRLEEKEEEEEEEEEEGAALAIISSGAFRSLLTSHAHVVDDHPSNPLLAISHQSGRVSTPAGAPPAPPPRYMATALVSASSLRQAATQLRDTRAIQNRRGGTNNRVTAALLRTGAAALRPVPQGHRIDVHGTTEINRSSMVTPSGESSGCLPCHSGEKAVPATCLSGVEHEQQAYNNPVYDPLQLTWHDLWNATWWAIRYRSRASVRQFKDTHGESACSVAALLLADEGTPSTDDRAIAIDFARTYHKEMQEWYAYDAQASDSLIDALRGCRCVPRHLARHHPKRRRGVCPTYTWVRGQRTPLYGSEQMTNALQQQEEDELAHNPHYLGCYGTTACQMSLFRWLRHHRDHSKTSTDMTVDGEACGSAVHRTPEACGSAIHRTPESTAAALSPPSRFVHSIREPTVGESRETGSHLSRLAPEFPLPPGVEKYST